MHTQLFVLFCTLLTINAHAQKNMNPNIGMNTLILLENSNRGNKAYTEQRNGISIQEAELQFNADVDPYWKILSTFSFHQEVEVDDSTTPPTRSAEYIFEPEELFAESLSLPFVTLKFGKFKAAMGKHNLLHTHAYPFIDAPLANQVLLGDEGLNDVGASASALLPASWFSELTLQGLSGQGEGLEYFQSQSANATVAVLHWKNFWDLNEDLSFEFGLSGANGQNSLSKTTNFHGSNLTFKWRQDASRSLSWTTEYLARDQKGLTDEKGRGLTSWIQYQFSQRWWAQIRGEDLKLSDQDLTNPDLLPSSQRKQSVLIGFVPTEFSAIRLQYDHLDDGASKAEQKLMLQLNYSIGAHPAHSY